MECGHIDFYCPEGSQVPLLVTSGFYSARVQHAAGLYNDFQDSKVTIRDRQYECEAGFYCVHGQRIPCPAGRYGDTVQTISVDVGNPSSLCFCFDDAFCSVQGPVIVAITALGRAQLQHRFGK